MGEHQYNCNRIYRFKCSILMVFYIILTTVLFLNHDVWYDRIYSLLMPTIAFSLVGGLVMDFFEREFHFDSEVNGFLIIGGLSGLGVFAGGWGHLFFFGLFIILFLLALVFFSYEEKGDYERMNCGH